MQGKIDIQKKDGKMTSESRVLLAKYWDEQPDGDYEWLIKRTTSGSSRYKFYFDAVMYSILVQAGHFFQMVVFVDGKPVTRLAETVQDIHLIMKMKYNPMEIVDIDTGEAHRVPCSTTVMNDSDFIGRYEEQIIADFSGPPWFVDFITFDQYKELKKKAEWKSFKDQMKNENT
jgi:hypothetical protein